MYVHNEKASKTAFKMRLNAILRAEHPLGFEP